jgi:multidrug resistance efflux pump
MNMRCAMLSFVTVISLGLTAAAQDRYGTLAAAVALVPNCQIVLADQADMPPQEAGIIDSIHVDFGTAVTKGQLLVQLDASKADAELAVAQAKLEAAKTKAVAADINVQYAVAANKVAIEELKFNKDANLNVPRSVPPVRINELNLKCKETDLAIQKAKSDQTVAEEESKVAAAEVAAARVMVERHKILSPLTGEVVDIRAHKGEAVQPSQAVVQVVRLDTVWVDGNVHANQYARAELADQDAVVNVAIRGKDTRAFPAKVIFVRPLTDAGDTYKVRAKVENRKVNGFWLLSPGMQAEMSIQLRKLDESLR